jgi:colanic acid biosynthesis glycosyl transferase WcaI
MRILFVNQYFPPDPAPTGILFREIADECTRFGHEVDFVDAGESYRAGQNQGGRMRRELAALRRMVAAGKARPRADVVVSGTSPPCLAVFADRIARAHRARHLHWAMDVYPEIAVALGEVRGGSLLARITGWMMGRAYRRCAAVIALDEDMAAVVRHHRIEPECIRPWVFRALLDQIPTLPQPPRKHDGQWIWLYSGNLGRAHEFETLLQAQKAIEVRDPSVRLVFQGGGPAWQKAQERARDLGLARCDFRDYVPEESLVGSLLGSDTLVVTQRPETQGLLWPSKLGLVGALPRPVLFVGPINGAIARNLQPLAHAGIFAPGDVSGVADWVIAQSKATGPITTTIDPIAHRAKAIAEWVGMMVGPTSPRCKIAG